LCSFCNLVSLPVLFVINALTKVPRPRQSTRNGHSANNIQIQSNFNAVFEQLNKWFKSNFLFLNFDKTYFIQFTSKSKYTSDIQIKYEDKQISIANETTFLALFINNNLSWKKHIECIQSQLSSACYAMRSVKPYVTINTLKMIYCSYFHFVMIHGILFWGNSPDSIKIFRLQKKIIRIMMGCRNTDSCRKLFFNLEILPLPSQYSFSLPLFMIRNKNQFLVNSEIYHTDTRQHANFHQPSANVTGYQKGVYYLGVKVFNMLCSCIKTESDNPKKFKVVLQKFFIWKFLLFLGWIFWTSQKLNIYIWFVWTYESFGIACSFSLFTNPYHKSVSIYIIRWSFDHYL